MTPSTQLQSTPRLSKPADPHARSFLTLPAEIRNCVYEALFCADGDIKMVFEGYECEIRHPDTTIVAGTPLFRTCRQLHLEAVGVLYGQNTFSFSALEGENLSILIGEASKWLTNIGWQMSRAAHLVIEVDVDEVDLEPVDVLPLLRHLWTHIEGRPSIMFRPSRPNYLNVFGETTICIEGMNRVLALLKADKYLDIRKFRRFPRLLTDVTLELDGRAGSLSFHRPGYSGDYPNTDFEFSVEDDRLIRPTAVGIAPSLGSILSTSDLRCRGVLLDMVCPFEQPTMTFDLLHRTVSPPIPAIFWVNRGVREDIYESLLSVQKVVARATAFDGDTTSIVRQLRSIERWPWRKPGTLVLRLETSKANELSDLRLDLIALIKATRTLPGLTNVRMELKNNKHSASQKYTILLSDFRHGALVALDSFSQKHPDLDKGECPTVWIDGKGAVRAMELDVSSKHVQVGSCTVDKSLTIVKSMATRIQGQCERRLSGQGAHWRSNRGQESSFGFLHCSALLDSVKRN